MFKHRRNRVLALCAGERRLLTAALLLLGGFVLFLLGMFSSFGPGRIRKEKP